MGDNGKTVSGRSGVPDIRWLYAGAIAGLLAAAFGILRQAEPGNELPEGALARVNDQFISRDNFERAVERMGTGSAGDDTRVLQRLVDDELLVQRGLELGIAQSDIAVRSAIVNSMIASVTAEADSADPSDEQLEQYLEDNAERFRFVARMSVAAWQSDDEAIAQDFVTALREDGAAAEPEAIDRVPGLPAGLAPVERLRDYLGPGITAAATDMPVGSSAVFARRGRWMVVQVLDKELDTLGDLDPIRNRVLMDFRRDLADSLLRDYLEDLRRRADVVVAQP